MYLLLGMSIQLTVYKDDEGGMLIMRTLPASSRRRLVDIDKAEWVDGLSLG